MRMIQIVESYESGVYVLKDAAERHSAKVGSLSAMLREADQRIKGQNASVLVLDRQGDVRKCLRFHSGRVVVGEDTPEYIHVLRG